MTKEYHIDKNGKIVQELDLFSLHYKGDEGNGINFMFFESDPNRSTLVGLTAQEAFDYCILVHNQFLTDYEKSGISVLDAVQDQLNEFIFHYNNELRNTTGILKDEIGFETYEANQILRLIIIVILTDIYTLTVMGRIINNEFNGTNFGYRYFTRSE